MPFYKMKDEEKPVTIRLAPRRYGQYYYGLNKALLRLKFNVSSIGFRYWIAAILDYSRNYWKYNNTIERVYEEIAKEFNTTRDRVERAMRSARKDATKTIQEEFNYYAKLSNKKVLELLAHNLMLLENDNHIPHID